MALAGLAVLFGACVAGAAGAGNSQLSFAPGPPIPAGSAPTSAAVADLNGDGRLDLALGNGGYWNDVRILLGEGAALFRANGPPVGVGGYPRAVTTADFNGDGKADLAVAIGGPNVVKILLGNGSGGITSTPGPVDAGGEPLAVFPADLNRDGNADLVVPVWKNGHRVTVLLGDGTGGFTQAAAPPPSLGRGDRVSVVVADLNGDGLEDLGVSNDGLREISLWPGNGAGGFGHPTTILAARNPGSLAVGDFNGDGRRDLVAVVGKGTVTLLGNGAGVFRRAGAPVAIRGGSLAVADFNGDGKADLTAADGAAGRVSVALGNGAGAFAVVDLSPFSVLSPRQLIPGDFNGDQKSDILTLSMWGSTWWPAPRGTSVLVQTPAGPQVPPPSRRRPRSTVFTTRAPIKLLAADGRRAGALTANVKKACGAVVVWTAPGHASRRFKLGYLGCRGDGVSELALGDRQVAWLEEGGGNNLELIVMAAKLAGRAAKQVDYVSNGDRAGGDPTGDWVGVLSGGGSVLAYDAWEVVCTHTDPLEDYCDWVGVGKTQLVRVAGGRRRVVRSGPGSYPLAAVGGGRMAVVSESGIDVIAPNGSVVVTVPDASEDPARAVALSSTRLAIQRTFTLELRNPKTGAKTTSLELGPAAALQLVGVNGKLALLRGPRRLVLVRLADGKLTSLPLLSPAGTPLVDVKLTEAGLFSAYNVPRAAKKGRIAFTSTATLLRSF